MVKQKNWLERNLKWIAVVFIIFLVGYFGLWTPYVNQRAQLGQSKGAMIYALWYTEGKTALIQCADGGTADVLVGETNITVPLTIDLPYSSWSASGNWSTLIYHDYTQGNLSEFIAQDATNVTVSLLVGGAPKAWSATPAWNYSGVSMTYVSGVNATFWFTNPPTVEDSNFSWSITWTIGAYTYAAPQILNFVINQGINATFTFVQAPIANATLTWGVVYPVMVDFTALALLVCKTGLINAM